MYQEPETKQQENYGQAIRRKKGVMNDISNNNLNGYYYNFSVSIYFEEQFNK